jgi:hypothetical protein
MTEKMKNVEVQLSESELQVVREWMASNGVRHLSTAIRYCALQFIEKDKKRC